MLQLWLLSESVTWHLTLQPVHSPTEDSNLSCDYKSRTYLYFILCLLKISYFGKLSCPFTFIVLNSTCCPAFYCPVLVNMGKIFDLFSICLISLTLIIVYTSMHFNSHSTNEAAFYSVYVFSIMNHPSEHESLLPYFANSV